MAPSSGKPLLDVHWLVLYRLFGFWFLRSPISLFRLFFDWSNVSLGCFGSSMGRCYPRASHVHPRREVLQNWINFASFDRRFVRSGCSGHLLGSCAWSIERSPIGIDDTFPSAHLLFQLDGCLAILQCVRHWLLHVGSRLWCCFRMGC